MCLDGYLLYEPALSALAVRGFTQTTLRIGAVRICYVLPSTALGTHHYILALANRMARAGHDVWLFTSSPYPRDRYLPEVGVRTPLDTRTPAFRPIALRVSSARE